MYEKQSGIEKSSESSISSSRRAFIGTAGVAAMAAAMLPGNAAAQQAGAESTYDRILRTGVLRVPAWAGNLPYFDKNISTGAWFGAGIDMVKDLATAMDGASVEVVEMISSAPAILALQSGQVDLAFPLTMTPERSRSLDFSVPLILHGFGLLAPKSLDDDKWADFDRPDCRVAAAIGTSDESILRRMVPKATVVGFKSRSDGFLALAANKVDCLATSALQGLAAIAKNDALGKLVLPAPVVATPTSIGLRMEADTKWLKVVNAWVDYNKSLGQIRDWYLAGLKPLGVEAADIPPSVVL